MPKELRIIMTNLIKLRMQHQFFTTKIVELPISCLGNTTHLHIPLHLQVKSTTHVTSVAAVVMQMFITLISLICSYICTHSGMQPSGLCIYIKSNYSYLT